MSSSPSIARAAVYRGPERMSVEEFPLPDIGEPDMLLEVIMCGVDGSELAMYRGAFEYVNERVPVIFGDEIIGRVAQIGAVAARRSWTGRGRQSRRRSALAVQGGLPRL